MPPRVPLDVSVDQVVCADAFDAAERLPGRSVDLVLTSPPYWGTRTCWEPDDERAFERWRERGGGDLDGMPPWAWYRDQGGTLGGELHPEWYVAHLVELFDALRPALKPTASVWVNLGDTYFSRWSSIRERGRRGLGDRARQRRRAPSGGWRHDKQLLLLPARFAIAMQDRGWVVRNDVIWAKPNATPQPVADRLATTHEHLFHLVLRAKGGRPKYFYDASQAESGARDVVTVPTGSPRGLHRATFPTQLIAPRIATSCPPGGVVLDPCCGSGTTLEVAAGLGRVAIGFEVSPQHAVAARARLRDVVDPAALTAA